MSKEKTILTDEEKKMLEQCKIDPSSWFTQTEVGFYAVLTDGEVTVPKEVIEKLKLEKDQQNSEEHKCASCTDGQPSMTS